MFSQCEYLRIGLALDFHRIKSLTLPVGKAREVGQGASGGVEVVVVLERSAAAVVNDVSNLTHCVAFLETVETRNTIEELN